MRDMIKCKNCEYSYERTMKACPNCSTKAPISFMKILRIILALVAAAALICYIIYVIKNPIDYGKANEFSSQIAVSSEKENSAVIDNSSTKEPDISSIISAPDVATDTSSLSGNSVFKKPTDKDNNISVSQDGTVSITIPKWFLLKIEPNYNYQLTDKEANIYKFTSVAKNADGSATYKVAYNDYHKFLLTAKSAVNAVVYEYSNNVWFSKIENDDGYNNINIYTKYNSLDNFDDGFDIYISLSGLQATFYQYVHYDYSVGTTITVYNKNNKVLATYKFPELLK